MKSIYQIGDLVIYKVEYRNPKGVVKGKQRPLIIISEPNSKGDYLAIAGSTKIHQWVDEEHILIAPDMVLGGRLDKPTIFPASKQILIDSKFIRVQIGRIPVQHLEILLRHSFSQYTKAFFHGVHAPKIEAPFIPGKSRINYAGRVYDEKDMINLVDSSLDFWLTAGRYAEKFEKEFAQFLEVKYCSLTNSGSSANLLAFMALTSPKLGGRRIRKGDEVITVAAGFPTTVSPIIQYGAIPVFVDVSFSTYNIDCDLLEDALSPKTKAVMLAHTMGNPFDIDRVLAFCYKHNLWLIEDNCDALGSRYAFKEVEKMGRCKGVNQPLNHSTTQPLNYRYTGSFGHISTFSFYPPHHITMGEGGAVCTNDIELKHLVESFRDWGRDCWCASGRDNTCGKRFSQQLGELPLGYDHKYVYSHFGYNLKVTDMQAAIGCAQLEKLKEFCEIRSANFQFLLAELKGLTNYFYFVEATKGSDPSWFGFLITLKNSVNFTRNDIVSFLEGRNIQTRNLFAGNITRHPCFDTLKEGRDYRIVGELKNTDKIMNDSFWLGVYPGFDEEKNAYMIESIRSFIRG